MLLLVFLRREILWHGRAENRGIPLVTQHKIGTFSIRMKEQGSRALCKEGQKSTVELTGINPGGWAGAWFEAFQ